MLIEKLTDNDIETIDFYRNTYADRTGYASNNDRADIQFVLRHWDDAKSQFLWKLFGEQFIIRKSITMDKNITELLTDFEEINHKMGNPYGNFKKRFYNIISSEAELMPYRYELMVLTDSYTVIKNKIPSDWVPISITFPNETRKFFIRPDEKLNRVLSKFASVYGIEKEYEDFRIFQSRVTNQKRTTGNLCLSIHPLDYMTMSDNNCGWSSCMTWMDDEGGEYSQGTVEMMNSPSVIVAYLESSYPFNMDHGHKWNSKKWRELFVITPDFHVGIKGYPYHSEELREQVQALITELAERNCGIHYDTKAIYEHSKIEVDEDTAYTLSFYTNQMYNDFDTSDTNHVVYLASDRDFKKYHNYFNYSGKSECMWCGSISEAIEENSRVCMSCINCIRCTNCEEYITDSDVIYVDGDPYCSWCVDEVCSRDSITGELHNNDNMTFVYLSQYETGADRYKSNCYIALYSLEDIKNYLVDLDLPREYYITGYAGYKYFDYYYVNFGDLNEKGKELFDVQYLGDDFFIHEDAEDLN